jgi:hypothetical protein
MVNRAPVHHKSHSCVFLWRSELPKKWSRGQQGFVVNDDWLLWDLKKDKKGAQVNFAPGENK